MNTRNQKPERLRKRNGEEYPPNTLLHILFGLSRHFRTTGNPTIDFKDAQFAELWVTVDAEMRRIQKKGVGSKKRQAEPITESEEDQLWEKGELEDHIPQTLLNTVVYMVGLYFIIRQLLELRAETRCKKNYLYHYISLFFL